MNAMRIDIPVLETERLILRAPSIDDFEAETAFYATARSQGVGGPHPVETVWQKLCERLGQWVMLGYGVWALDDKATGTYLGRVGILNPHEWPERELAWTLMAGAEGKGMAMEACLAVRDYVYRTHGWTTLMSVIMPPNTRSCALARRLGCWHEKDWEHPTHGTLNIWRHPGPEQLA